MQNTTTSRASATPIFDTTNLFLIPGYDGKKYPVPNPKGQLQDSLNWKEAIKIEDYDNSSTSVLFISHESLRQKGIGDFGHKSYYHLTSVR